MTILVDLDIKKYLAELASDSPAPGGGAVAALNGAQGSALLSMVSNLTLTKDEYKEHHDNCNKILAIAKESMDFFIKQVDDDSNAFSAVIDGFRMPKNNEKEIEARAKTIRDGYRVAVNVPMDSARTAYSLLEHAENLAAIGNPQAISDVGVSALCLQGAIHGSLLNVNINLGSKWIKKDQPEFGEQLQGEIASMADVDERVKNIMKIVNERM